MNDPAGLPGPDATAPGGEASDDDPDAKPTPRVFYKFRSMAGEERARTLDLMRTCRLWFSTAAGFNDPFDCLAVYTAPDDPADLAVYARRLVAEMGAHLSPAQRAAAMAHIAGLTAEEVERRFHQQQERLRRAVGLYCLSARWDHILMWAHYADSHRGLCIGFRPVAVDDPFALAYPVKYQKARPTIEIGSRDPANLDRQLLTKADFWCYEREWRIVRREGPGPHPIDPRSLAFVILGAAMSDLDRAEVVAIARERGMRVAQARLDARDYRLVLVEADA